MLPNLKTVAITTVTALSIALGAAAPAAAWGQREQDTLKGVVGALIITSIINDARRDRGAPVYHEEPQPIYNDGYYHPPKKHKPKPVHQSVYRTPAAHAFNSYSASERRLIQRRLAHWGYYQGGIDGSFGPGTYSAIAAYARDNGQGQQLASTAGAFGVYDGLIF